MNDAVLRLLGLARKAGRLEAGEEPVGAACRSREARLLFVAPGAAPNPLRRAAHFGQAGKVLLIDNPPIVRVFQGPGSELERNLPLELGNQPVMDRPVAVDIVRGHAGLAAVEKFAEHDPPRRQRDICCPLHHAGALAPQLQGDRGEMLRCCGHDGFAHGLAAGEKNVVKPLLEQAGILLPASGDHRRVPRLEAGADQPLHQGGGVGGIGAGLEDSRIAGGDGVHQRVQSQQKGVVPWAHD